MSTIKVSSRVDGRVQIHFSTGFTASLSPEEALRLSEALENAYDLWAEETTVEWEADEQA